MYARRFRLDAEGNLHADRLFCRPFHCEPSLTVEAQAWAKRRLTEARKAKSIAMLAFEAAWSAGLREEAHTLAHSIHVHMLAQRLRKGGLGRASTGETSPWDNITSLKQKAKNAPSS